MRVTLAQHGGFAASIRRPVQAIDVDRLDHSAAASLSNRVRAAIHSSRESGESASRAIPDAMSYSITIENQGQPIILRGTDTSMSPEFAELLDELEQILASQEQ